MSETTTAFVQKIAAVIKSFDHVEKRGQNKAQGYNYATDADILAAVRGAMADQGLVLIPKLESIQHVPQGETKNGAPIVAARLVMGYMLTDGAESFSLSMPGEGMDSGDKATYKALTGAMKYALRQLFLIPTGDDPEKETPDVKRDKPAAKPKPGPADEAPPRLSAEQVKRLWDLARLLWPDKAQSEAQIKALLARHGVTATASLDPARIEDYVNELDAAKAQGE